jgi:hypothetical protein
VPPRPSIASSVYGIVSMNQATNVGKILIGFKSYVILIQFLLIKGAISRLMYNTRNDFD